MSKFSLTGKKAKITSPGNDFPFVLKKPMYEVWMLKEWLMSLNLSNCYPYLYSLSVDELMNINERQIYKMFPSRQVFKIVDSVEEVRATKKFIIDMKRRLLDSKCDLTVVFKELENILPDQFVPLLGPISTFFVDAMMLVWNHIHKIRKLNFKHDYQHTFYKLCLRGDLADTFMECDKEYLRKWRKAYQAERKLLKDQAKEAKK